MERPSVIPVAASVFPENSLSYAPISNFEPNGIGRCVPLRSINGAVNVSLATVVKLDVAALNKSELSLRSNLPLSKSTNPASPARFPAFEAKVNRFSQLLQ